MGNFAEMTAPFSNCDAVSGEGEDGGLWPFHSLAMTLWSSLSLGREWGGGLQTLPLTYLQKHSPSQSG